MKIGEYYIDHNYDRPAEKFRLLLLVVNKENSETYELLAVEDHLTLHLKFRGNKSNFRRHPSDPWMEKVRVIRIDECIITISP